ncbi:MAG TPA: hypothetical protein VIX63_16885, partial [Vicinamibacterales bacterium]
ETITRGTHTKRNRRLEPDEESRLLACAGPHLQRLIIGAVETCCRFGELLALRRDLQIGRRDLVIRAEQQGARKTGTGRVLPISARLLAALEMARMDPAGAPFGVEAFVFGDAVGRKVARIRRAWETCVLKAHGHTPAWTPAGGVTLPSRTTLDRINLHFHDMRHEHGLQESMRRLDAARCKSVANEGRIDPPPHCNDVDVIDRNVLIN